MNNIVLLPTMKVVEGACKSYSELMFDAVGPLKIFGFHIFHADFKEYSWRYNFTSSFVIVYYLLALWAPFRANNFVEAAFSLATFALQVQVWVAILNSSSNNGIN